MTFAENSLLVQPSCPVLSAIVTCTSKSNFVLMTVGIGKETVKVLAAAGAKVIMTSRDLAAGQEVATELMQSKVMVSTSPSPAPSFLTLNHLACRCIF